MLIITLSMACAASPLPVVAEDVSSAFQPIVITEVQAGTTTSASQEFIELYNQSLQSIDMQKDGWQLQIATSTAADWSKAKTVTLSGVLRPGTYMLAASTYTVQGEAKSYLQEYVSGQFASGLTATAGHIRLVSKESLASTRLTEDVVEWSLQKDGEAATASIASQKPFLLDGALPAGNSLKRVINADNRFVATGNSQDDFIVSQCPSPTANNDPIDTTVISGPVPTTIDTVDQACVPVESPDPDPLPLSDTDPPATLLPAEGVSTKAAPKPTMPAANAGLTAPQISELLPNPAAPQTDAADEFIELYNPNNQPYDLSGFKLAASSTKQFTFPVGTTIAPLSFKAFFSAHTRLSLANGSGQARLFDPLGRLISQSEPYSQAKEGLAWVRASGGWHWTSSPTPNSANVVKPPAAKAAKQASAKKTVASALHNTKAKPTTSANDQAYAATVVPTTPLHPRVLAVVGGFALLYGAYEYRRDVANKFYQLRNYRAARRALGKSVAGRRGNRADK